MEDLTKEMHKANMAGDHHQQVIMEGGGGAEEDDRKAQKGKTKNGGGGGGGGGMLRTPADIYEHPGFYSFILDMPGLDVPNIKVKVENGVLHVTGKRKKNRMGESSTSTSIDEGVKAIRLERRRARYMRKFNLPSDVSQEEVEASYKDGVLTVQVTKKKPIEVQLEFTFKPVSYY